MKFGLFMMPLHPTYREVADCYDRDIDQLVLADKVGFDEAWLGEHFTEKWENAPAPDLLIAKALALTERIRFGTGVTLLGMHEPVYLAHRVAMLDHLARGRFQWGIGLGGIPTDMALMGLDPSEGRARAVEALDVVLGLWDNDGTFRYDGEFFKIDAPELDPVTERGLHMKPLQQPHPPIAVAASTSMSGSLKVAGARGWSPMSSSILSRSFLPGHWETFRAAAEDAGNEPNHSDWRIARDIFVGPTPASARERARAVLGRNYDVHQLPSRQGTVQMDLMKLDPKMKDEEVDVDYLMENVWIVGDPQECADKIRELYEEVGGFGTLLSITADSDDVAWDYESLTLLVEKVGPLVDDLT
ncbi:MAG: LLM class flavin-dependent oxidoreductase [Pseudomonadota bacterium]|nr:LLM class flavin-dependent oxidoreductase [Pseudomonadota bacterium]